MNINDILNGAWNGWNSLMNQFSEHTAPQTPPQAAPSVEMHDAPAAAVTEPDTGHTQEAATPAWSSLAEPENAVVDEGRQTASRNVAVTASPHTGHVSFAEDLHLLFAEMMFHSTNKSKAAYDTVQGHRNKHKDFQNLLAKIHACTDAQGAVDFSADGEAKALMHKVRGHGVSIVDKHQFTGRERELLTQAIDAHIKVTETDLKLGIQEAQQCVQVRDQFAQMIKSQLDKLYEIARDVFRKQRS